MADDFSSSSESFAPESPTPETPSEPSQPAPAGGNFQRSAGSFETPQVDPRLLPPGSQQPQTAPAQSQPVRFDPGRYFANFADDPANADHHSFLSWINNGFGPAGYNSFITAIADLHKEQMLQHYGASLPENLPTHIRPEVLGTMPENLRSTALSLRPDVWGELEYLNPDARNRILTSLGQAQELAQELDRRDRQERESSFADSERRQNQWADNLATESITRRAQALEKWEPFAGDRAQNQTWRDGVINAAFGHASLDPQMRQLASDVHYTSQLIGLARLQNNHRQAAAYEASVQMLVREWDERMGRFIARHKMAVESVITDAMRWRQHMAEQAIANDRAAADAVARSRYTPGRQPGQFGLSPDRIAEIADGIAPAA